MTKIITLFLFKIYGSSNLININDLLTFLEISQDKFLQTGAKILINDPNDDTVQEILNSLSLTDINEDLDEEIEFILEILLPFDSILKLQL
jgi:hypothetical protein